MMTRQGRSLGKGRRRSSLPPPSPPVFCPKKSKHPRIISQNIETMMSLQLGETVSGFKIQRPVQWVLDTQNSLLFDTNEIQWAASILCAAPPSFLGFATALKGEVSQETWLLFVFNNIFICLHYSFDLQNCRLSAVWNEESQGRNVCVSHATRRTQTWVSNIKILLNIKILNVELSKCHKSNAKISVLSSLYLTHFVRPAL